MAERMTILQSGSRVARFKEFMAQQESEFRLVEIGPSPSVLDKAGEESYFTAFTIEADETWRFFSLGRDWALFDQEGGLSNG